MTELNYQTPSASSGEVTVAWIVLLVLGSIYCLFGLCICLGAGLAVSQALNAGAPGTFTLGLVSISILLYFVGVGITCVWASLRLRQRSRRAAKIGMIVCIANTLLIVAIYMLGLVAAISLRTDPISFIVGTLFYGGAAAANTIPAWLLKRALVDLPIPRSLSVEV